MLSQGLSLSLSLSQDFIPDVLEAAARTALAAITGILQQR